MNRQIKDLTLTALFVSIVAISTIVIQIPTISGGYVHIGDSAILIIAVFFGKKKGSIAGGLGSALADMISGYPQYIPFTFLIKALMGLVAGSLFDIESELKFLRVKNLIMALIVEIIMVAGYYLSEIVITGTYKSALAGVPANLVQGLGGIIIYLILGQGLYKSKILNNIENI